MTHGTCLELLVLTRFTVMLVALQKVEQETIDDLKQIFHALDTNGNGTLDKDDLVGLNEKKLHELERFGFSSDNVAPSSSDALGSEHNGNGATVNGIL